MTPTLRIVTGEPSDAATPSPTSARIESSSGPVERWDAARLVDLVPGTTRKLWLAELVPELVAIGVLVKRGRAWFGRRPEIEAALLGRHAPTPTRGRRSR